MMQRPCSSAAIVDDQHTTHQLDFLDNIAKGDCGESIDDSSTLFSNSSSDEDHSMHSKCSNTPHRILIILLSIVFGFSVLGLGYWMGWIIGERRNSSNSSTIETDPLNPITDSSVGNPTNTWPFSPEISPNAVPAENHHTDSTSGTVAPSDSQIESNVVIATKSPIESPTSPMNNFELPTNLPIESVITAENNIESPTKPLTGSSTSPETAPVVVPVNTLVGTEPVVEVTYIPGNLTRMQNDLLLSEGLEARIIARTGKLVQYLGGSASDIHFHTFPDAGATFPDTRWWNSGGWIYVSNSEAKNETEGGVGAITFDRHGSVVHYGMVLENTHMNCGGGRTPWNTWVSCEEVEFTGQIYQVDPTGQRPSERMSLGSAGGRWESFAYDIRDKEKPHFFTTEDHNKGCTRRFTPKVTTWGGDEWKMLHEEGVVDYLFVNPNDEHTGGTFEWVDDIEGAKNNARTFYPQSEGIDIQDGKMYIVCKKIQQLFVFDLDQMTFHNVSTVSGLFDGDPDQMQRILGSEGGLLYFTEEGGEDAGVHARDEFGRFFTILESPFLLDESTGLSFSPDGTHMYIAYQENGILFDVTREDGFAFDAKSLDVKYHHSISSRRLNSQWIGI